MQVKSVIICPNNPKEHFIKLKLRKKVDVNMVLPGDIVLTLSNILQPDRISQLHNDGCSDGISASPFFDPFAEYLGKLI